MEMKQNEWCTFTLFGYDATHFVTVGLLTWNENVTSNAHFIRLSDAIWTPIVTNKRNEIFYKWIKKKMKPRRTRRIRTQEKKKEDLSFVLVSVYLFENELPSPLARRLHYPNIHTTHNILNVAYISEFRTVKILCYRKYKKEMRSRTDCQCFQWND